MVLPIKNKWYEMILSGHKKEEYREIKPYYEARLQNLFGAILIEPTSIFQQSKYELLQGKEVPEEIRKEPVQDIIFRNGYSKNSPSFKARCSLSVGTGKTEWGAEEGKQYYILKILEVKQDE